MAARTLPNVGLKGFWGLSFDGWDTENDLNMLTLSVLVQGYFDSKEAALPGSPSDGDIVVLDEDHGTHPNEIVVRDDGAWVYIVPNEGWKLYNVDQQRYEFFDGSVWAQENVGLNYRFGGFAEADILADEVLMRHIVIEGCTLAPDLVGCLADVETNPADGAWAGLLKQDGTAIGTVSISTGGVVTMTTTSNEEKPLTVGNVITFVAPASPDSAIAGLTFSFQGVIV